MLQPSATDSASCDSLDAVIAALDAASCTPRRSGTGYTSRCPAHADRNPSLSVTAGDRQPVILKCHAGCTYDEIVTALHLERPAPRSTPTRGAPEAVYDYTTYEVVRFSGKRFYQRRPDGKSGYHWNLRGVTPRLYHQDEIFLCVAIVEGEKDVDALRDHLVKHQRPGIGKDARFPTTATCNSGGAGNWTSVNTQALLDNEVEQVLVIPDNDNKGRKHAHAVATSCAAAGITVKMFEIPAPHKDVSDYLAAGGDMDVRALFQDAPAWSPADVPVADALPVARLEPISDLTPGQTEWIIPNWLAAGEFHLLAGQAGMGKTTLAMKIAAMVSQLQDFTGGSCAGGDVVIWSGEDDYEKTLLARLLVNGADPAHVHFVRTVDDASGDAREFNPADHIPALARALEDKPDVRLVILDPILAIAAGARDSYRPEDVRKCLLPIREVTRVHGVAVLGVTHFLKRHNSTGSDPLDRVIGSQAWGAVARVVLAVDKLEDGGRGLMIAKSNLGATCGGYTYKFVEEPIPTDDPSKQPVAGLKVYFPGRLSGEAADVFRPAASPRDHDRETARDSATAWLTDYLTEQPRPWAKIVEAGKDEGHTKITLRRARDTLKAAGVIDGRRGIGNTYTWYLKASEPASRTEDT